jgi:hypothetical protein
VQAKTPRCLQRRVEGVACLPGPPWFLLAPEPLERQAVVPLTCPKVARRLGAALARPQLPLGWGARAVVLGVT